MTDIEWLRSVIDSAEPPPWIAVSYGRLSRDSGGAFVKDRRGEMAIGCKPDGSPDMDNAKLIATLRNIAPVVVELLHSVDNSPCRHAAAHTEVGCETCTWLFKVRDAIRAERERVEGKP